MHTDQVDITAEAVAGLVAAQFPQWRAHRVRSLPSHGTVNALFRLGDDIVLRLPLRPDPSAAMRESLELEQDNARRLIAHTRLQIPAPLALGRPAESYAGWWSAYRWIPGRTAGPATIGDPLRFARDLAGFVGDLHAIATDGRVWTGHGRGGPLAGLAPAVDSALAESDGLVDTGRVDQVWQRCLRADPHAGPDVWIHADLMPGNLLVHDGRLVAVIDLGSVCIGDPAVDLMVAWNLLSADARRVYRHELAVDEATWERGRGWAVAQAIMALPYYQHSNPVMADTARHTLAAAVA